MTSKRYCPVRDIQCPVESKIQSTVPFCFIAIPSSSQWYDSRETIKEILNENGIFPYVADEDVTAGKDIFCKICERILSSTFGVIELTEKNPNVMLEFGLILGNQKPVFILQNKAIAPKTQTHLPTDITALERIEYSNQKELRAQFSKGLRTYLEKICPTLKRGEEKQLTEANSEDLELVLEAIKSNNYTKRYEGAKDMYLLSFNKRIIHDTRVVEIIGASLDDPESIIRREFLGIIKIILRVEDEEHKQAFAATFFEKIGQISLEDEDMLVRESAFSALEETKNPLVIDFAFKAIQETSNEKWTRFSSNIISCLRAFNDDNYRRTLTKKLYAMLDDPKLQTRVHEVLEQLRVN